MSITLSDFAKQFQAETKAMQDFIDNTAPRLAGAIVIAQAKENFQKESFEGKPWKEVQRRTPGTSAYRYNKEHHPKRLIRKILTGDTGDLGRSIKAKYDKASVTIFSDNNIYAKVHNEGLRAGRGAGFIMPRRQFLGDSPKLREQINEQISDKIKELFGK